MIEIPLGQGSDGIYGTDTAYPMHVKAGVLTFRCAAHGNDASCEECANAEILAIASANIYAAYVSSDRKRITTFSGCTLGRITDHHTGKRKWMPNGGSWLPTHVTAMVPGGDD